MTIEELQHQKAELEITKLRAEIANLRRPFWLAQGHYLLALSGVAALAVGLYQIKKTNHEFRLAEYQKIKLEAENAVLQNKRADLDAENKALAKDRDTNQQENVALGAQMQEMTRYITALKPTATDFNARMNAIRAKTFPIQSPALILKLPHNLKGQLVIEVAQDGKLAAHVNVAGVTPSKTIATPELTVHIHDIQSSAPDHPLRVPAFTFNGKPHQTPEGFFVRADYQYNVKEPIPLDPLPTEIADNLFSSSQIEIIPP